MLLPQRLAKSRIVTAFMMVSGLALAVAGTWYIYTNASFLGHSQRAAGTVLELVAKRSAKGMTLYHPRVGFVLPGGGRAVTFRSRVGLWPSPFSVGQNVVVAFESADPEKARIVSVWTLWFIPGCMIGLGLLALVLGWTNLKR